MHNLMDRLDDFSDPQLAATTAILAVIETVVDERMEEILTSGLKGVVTLWTVLEKI